VSEHEQELEAGVGVWKRAVQLGCDQVGGSNDVLLGETRELGGRIPELHHLLVESAFKWVCLAFASNQTHQF